MKETIREFWRELVLVLKEIPKLPDRWALDYQLSRHHWDYVPMDYVRKRLDPDGLYFSGDEEMPWCVRCDALWPCAEVDRIKRGSGGEAA